jgi:RHS repeat-associated protein
MWTWYSDPFGTDAANANPSGAGTFAYNLRLPGQVFDGAVGLHLNGARNYDPAVGRYVESDPIGLQGGLNTYAYANGNPISEMDPLGLWGIGDPLPQGAVDAVTGFGDAFLIPILVRDVLDLNGSVDQCSSAYKSGEIAGTIWGLIPVGLEETALLADRTVLNSNRYFRIGLGRIGKDRVPRISSPYLPGNGHLPLSPRLPTLPPVGAAVSPQCGCGK